jgi:formate dehydrogenase maturation protein FdhE
MSTTVALPGDLQAELDAELDAIEAASRGTGVSTEYLSFCGHIARAQSKARAAIRARWAGDGREEPKVRGHLLALDQVGFDDELLLELLRDIEAAAQGEGREEHIRVLLAAAEVEPGLLGRLAAAATLGSDARPLRDAAGRLGVTAEALVYLARLLAAPFLLEARHRRGTVEEVDVRGLGPVLGPGAGEGDGASSEVRIGLCPGCGSAAGMAVLRAEDGARRLLCLLCGEAWLAPRLMCASCGTRDQAQLGMVAVAKDDPRWIEVCDLCRRYLKTVDEGRLPAGHTFVPRVEDARTLHLDLIAEREGYVRPAL